MMAISSKQIRVHQNRRLLAKFIAKGSKEKLLANILCYQIGNFFAALRFFFYCFNQSKMYRKNDLF